MGGIKAGLLLMAAGLVSGCEEPQPWWHVPCLKSETKQVVKSCMITPLNPQPCLAGQRFVLETVCVQRGEKQCVFRGKQVPSARCRAV